VKKTNINKSSIKKERKRRRKGKEVFLLKLPINLTLNTSLRRKRRKGLKRDFYRRRRTRYHSEKSRPEQHKAMKGCRERLSGETVRRTMIERKLNHLKRKGIVT